MSEKVSRLYLREFDTGEDLPAGARWTCAADNLRQVRSLASWPFSLQPQGSSLVRSDH